MSEALVSPLTEVDFYPATTLDEIVQNVRCIITTIKGSVPLDRDFGVNGSYIDEPEMLAMMYFRMYLIEGIERYEPRVIVKKIEFKDEPDEALDGRLLPLVTIEIKEEYA